jgi:hypothetical protein
VEPSDNFEQRNVKATGKEIVYEAILLNEQGNCIFINLRYVTTSHIMQFIHRSSMLHRTPTPYHMKNPTLKDP